MHQKYSFCTTSSSMDEHEHEVAYTLEQLKEVRSLSGAPLKECKKALVNTKNSDNRITAAIDWLRIRGKAIAAQKSGDVAQHGFIGMYRNENDAALVEVNCVTDFVEHNPVFQEAVMNISHTVFRNDSDIFPNYGLMVEELQNLPIIDAKSAKRALFRNDSDIFPNYGLMVEELQNLPIIDAKSGQASAQSIREALTDIIGSIRENLVFRRAYKMHCTPAGVLCGYLHGRKNENLGMKGSLVSLETDLEELNEEQRGSLKELGQQIATHVVANYPQPKYISREELSAHEIEKERELIMKTILEKEGEGQNMEIVQKQLEGRMNKFFVDNVLLEQPYCLEDDSKLTIAKMLKLKGHQMKCNVYVAHMVCYNLGEP
eukprot:CAMPEP_0197075484 /NCGR_PEP_ID=MMETSP1384-20130603/211632_1 /TAXON_ID=29189 /ORGANISM="Ammonia sp." /LENGTH=373 /DNA_ID=CAMNT_0042514333 /DNA_START=400 /DNA_END=1522 /DNA_ORIENTATION=-